jgi:pimeloyl-ACP methyl ester carboxylesterase
MGIGTPETRYARSGDVMIAYQVVGDGPFDVVFAPGTVSHVELYWEAAGVAALLRGVARHARLLVFDKRGTGLSGRVAEHWTAMSTFSLPLRHLSCWQR